MSYRTLLVLNWLIYNSFTFYCSFIGLYIIIIYLLFFYWLIYNWFIILEQKRNFEKFPCFQTSKIAFLCNNAIGTEKGIIFSLTYIIILNIFIIDLVCYFILFFFSTNDTLTQISLQKWVIFFWGKLHGRQK